jgi:hypothetical protein
MKKILVILIVILFIACIMVRFLVKNRPEKQVTKPIAQAESKITEVPTIKKETKIAEKEKKRDPFTKPEILTKLEKENEKLKKELKTLKTKQTKTKIAEKTKEKAKKAKRPEDIEKIKAEVAELKEKFKFIDVPRQSEIQEYEAEPEEEYYEEPEDYEAYPVYYRPIVYVGGVWPFYWSWYWVDYWWYLGWYPSYYYNLWRWDSYYGCYYTYSSRLYVPRKGRLTVISKDQLQDKNNPRLTVGQYKSNLSKNITTKDLGKFGKATKRVSKTGQIKTYRPRSTERQIQKIKSQKNPNTSSGRVSRRDNRRYETPWGDSRNFNKSFKSSAKTRSSNSGLSRKSITRRSSSGKKVSSSSTKQRTSTSSRSSRSVSGSRGKVTKSTSRSSGKVKKR